MKIEVEIKDGFVQPRKVNIKDGIYVCELKNQDLRTLAQNNAIHLYLTMLSSELNGAGYSFTKVMRTPQLYKADIDWNMELAKSNLWKPIQEAILKKKSTTQLTKEEVTKVYDNLNRYTSERMGIGVPFPNKVV